jgi:hypothetical protein
MDCLHGIHPCLGALANRYIVTNSSCPLCLKDWEDIKNTLFICEGAGEIWRKMGLWCELGGLGVSEQRQESHGVSLHHPWTSRLEESSTRRQGLKLAARIEVGNGEKCFFWLDKWLNGLTIEQIAHAIYKMIHPNIKARRTVADAIRNGRWMDDINRPLTIQAFSQILAIYEEIRNFHLHQDVEDNWTWLWEAKWEYTAKSVYTAHLPVQFLLTWLMRFGNRGRLFDAKLRHGCSSGGIWTADRLGKRGLPHNDKCVFCKTEEENVQHLFLGCAVVSIIWGSILNWAGLSQVAPSTNLNPRLWWLHASSNLQNPDKSKFNTLVMLTSWSIWHERNRRVFRNEHKSMQQIISQIKTEAIQWALASGGRFSISMAVDTS